MPRFIWQRKQGKTAFSSMTIASRTKHKKRNPAKRIPSLRGGAAS
jgi:hypothetical protein